LDLGGQALSIKLLAWTPWVVFVQLIRVAAKVKYKYVVGLVSQVGATFSLLIPLSPPISIYHPAIAVHRSYDGENSA
jgi:hypothetical protein